MSLKEYKEFKETGVVPWYKAGAVKRFYLSSPTFEQVDMVDEISYSILLVSLLLGLVLGLLPFVMLVTRGV